jgi:predicted regulator of Ras-like GTPase activity (Roadblock/LC7/MglB family)
MNLNVAVTSSAIVGTVAGGAFSAAGSVVGNITGGIVEGITGIKKENQWMIWYGLGAIIILIIVWRIYSMISG